MMHFPTRPALAAVFLTVALASPLAAKPPEVSRQVQVTDDFRQDEIAWNGVTGGYTFLHNLRDDKGIIELCGVGVYTNGQVRAGTTQVLRSMTLKMDGKVILSDFRFFNKAPSKRKLRTTPANCASTGIKVPRKRVKFEFESGGVRFNN